MRRRDFIVVLGGTAAGWPASAQPARPKIGILVARNPARFLEFFREGLRQLGYVDGENIELVLRSAEGRMDRLPELATELVRAEVAMIIAHQTPTVLAAMKATKDVPIVMAPAGDPLSMGIVPSLSRPGGNVTGVHSATAQSVQKTLEVSKEILPSLRTVGAALNVLDPFSKPFSAQIELAAKALNLEVAPLRVEGDRDLPRAYAEAAAARVDIVIVQPSLSRDAAASLALQHRVPAVAPNREFPEAGCLLSYSSALADEYRKAAGYVQKILRGAKPADLPVEQPNRFELVLNMKTAERFGITLPPLLLARADEVIE
jgi:putative ABC transport system substrate-binding protein